MIPTNHGMMTVPQVVDYLVYANYRFNRNNGMSAERLKRIYPQSADAMEEQYQAERAQR